MIDFLSDDSNDDDLNKSLSTILQELNQRNEVPYDGVLGYPPNSITEVEKNRFISIRNRLLDGEEGFTEADIHGLINDCNSNANSFSHIPDRLKQDIRFLASLWRGTKKDGAQAETGRDDAPGSQACKPIKPLEKYLIDPSLGLDVNLDHFTLIDLWRYDENLNPLITTGDCGLETILIKAVRDGELNAIVHKRERPWEKEKGNGAGYIKVDKCDFNDISNTGWLGGSYVRLTIHRDDFKAWLKKTNQRLPDGCLLQLWLEGDEPQSKAVGIDGEVSQDKSELIATRTIPAHLLPDSNYQFLINHPFAPVFDPDKPLPTGREPIPSGFVQPEPDEWFLYDSWGIKLACKLITLGYPVCLDRLAEEAKDLPHNCEGRDRFSSIVRVYERTLGIAASSVKVGTINEHDTPANWIAWAKSKGYSVAHLMPGDTQPQAEAAKNKGIGSIKNGKKENQLHKLIWRVYLFLAGKKKRKTAQAVWNEIQQRHTNHDTDNIIQEVVGNQICWCSGYGNEQTFKRSTLDKTLSNLKKKPPY